VSGALGMRTDDPKLFQTAVKITDCSVVILSTKRKSKTPASAGLPQVAESDDVQLSQSATDVKVHIELPKMGAESTSQGG